MAIYCGAQDNDGISHYYKATLTQEIPNVGSVSVVGYISGQTSIELGQLWSSPFDGDTAGNAHGVQKAAQMGQTGTGTTTKALWNSKLVWDGAEAMAFNLPLQFIAFSDAKLEVNDPIQYLLQMSSPELNNTMPMGSIPLPARLNMGRRIITHVFVKNVSYDESAPKTTDGYFTHNELNLSLSLDGAINASQIPEIFK